MKTYSKPSRKYAKRKRHFKQYRDNRAPKHKPPHYSDCNEPHYQLRGNR